MRMLASLLLAGSLGLLVAPATAGPGTPPPREPVQSFAYSADCGEDPGQMEVRTESIGPEQFRLAMRAEGLEPGFNTGMIEVWGDVVPPPPPFDTWDLDSTATEVEHEVVYPGPLTTGRLVIISIADFFPPMGICSVSGRVGESDIRVRSQGYELIVSSRRILVSASLDCRSAPQVSGTAVIGLADRTVEKGLRPGECLGRRHGSVLLKGWFPRTSLPRSVSVDIQHGDVAWQGQYELVLPDDAQDVGR